MQIEISDGIVSAGDEVWVAHRSFSEVSIDKGYIEKIYNDKYYGILLSIKIFNKYGGSVSISGYTPENLIEHCYKEYKNADIKRVELVMCKE